MPKDWSAYRTRNNRYTIAEDHRDRLKRLAIPLRYSSYEICVSDWPRVSRYADYWNERDYDRNTKWKRHVKKAANRKDRREWKKEWKKVCDDPERI